MYLASLIEHYPAARLDDAALDAVRAMADAHRPGLIVLDGDQPTHVLSGPDVLSALIPRYVLDDPTLARVLDAGAADEIFGKLADMRVADLLPDRPLREIPVLTVRDTTMEAAALMAEERIHMVAVTRDKRYVGCVTVSALLRHLLVDFVDDGAEE